MRKQIVSVLKVVSLIGMLALVAAPLYAQVSQLFPDPCQTGFSSMQSVPIAIASATTTQLVAPVAGQKVTVCGIWLNSVGGTSTLEYGTSTACTGTHAMTGAFAAATTVSFLQNHAQILASTPASQGVCLVSGSSTSATEGFMLYVQQ